MIEGSQKLGIRWTVGDVSRNGFEALRLSVWGAWRLFGPEAAYTICVNSLPVEAAEERVGDLPDGVRWHAVSRNDVPSFLRPHLDRKMAEGTAWKLSPLRLFPHRYELSMDNDCILWGAPRAIRTWLRDESGRDACVLAEDVRQCANQFAELCGHEPRNAGLRGLPPGFDLETALRTVLTQRPVVMTSELDEQGIQTAALSRAAPLRIVSVEEVTVCSPFPPHLPHLGSCGAHFVGLNAQKLAWSKDGRPAVDHVEEHWDRHREAIYERVGLSYNEESGMSNAQ